MNKKFYKDTFSPFCPSEKAVERVFEMTTDKKRNTVHVNMKRVCAVAFAFVLLIGGGLGVKSIVAGKADDGLGVMIAYAGEKKLLKAGNLNEQQLFYRIYVADIEDEQECYNVKNEWGNEKAELLELASNLGENDISACVKSHSTSCYSSEQDKDTAYIYTLGAGLFSLNLDDYTNVESITVENTSAYGEMNVELAVDSEELLTTRTGHQISMCAEELKFSVDSGLFRWNSGEGEINKGYDVYWSVSQELRNAIGNNVDFDLSEIEDKIIFTVNYSDGSFEKASVDLKFDKDGYMNIVAAD